MTPEQWARVERLYHAADAQPREKRLEWLARECAGDEVVRREVESLLAQHASSNDLLESSALTHLSGAGEAGESLIGQRVGSFEIVALIDEGGMGQVYRARDLTLPRDVAAKVIPPALAHDPARRARFRQEAELLASLSHPHIAHVYAFVEDGGRTLLVMELVGGRTLAERISRGPIPLAEALPIARQIADALDAAHEQGVVHRDLKPANVKIMPNGAVKVLDFGLAVPLRRAVNGGAPREHRSLLGTAAYLSPERTRGETEDRRGDIWAFGCVLFEMLAGRQAFAGATVTEILTAILEREPDWSALPATLPEGVRSLLRRCLDKDPRRRLRDIGEARVLLDDLIAAPPAPSTAPRNAGRIAAAAAVLLAVGATAWFVGTQSRGDAGTAAGTARLFVGTTPADSLPARPTRTDVALSPDGRTLVFSGLKEGRQQLYVRAMDAHEATPIPGTENSNSPFFSPDGRWLAFWQGTYLNGSIGELRRVRLDGGAPATIAKTALLFGATWGADDTIVFANAQGGLLQVPAAGGTPRAFTELDASQNEFGHRLPHFLPDGRSILFTVTVGQSASRFAGTARLVARSLVDNRQRTVLTGGIDGRYVETGHIVYANRNTLMAVPFDRNSLTVIGTPITVVDGVLQAHGPHVPGGVTAGETGAAQFSVSRSGALVYVAGKAYAEPQRSLVWMDRAGGETPLAVPPHSYLGPRVSPDGRRLVVYVIGFEPGMWLYDLRNRTFTPTLPESDGIWPIWTVDGTSITFGREPPMHLSSMQLDGAGTNEILHEGNGVPGAWSPDGSTLAFARLLPTSGWELREWSRERGDRRLLPPVSTPSLERYPTFSPNGRWLAYASNDSGRDEVYVRAYPGASQRRQISTNGGLAPAWSRDGREFYFMTGVNGNSQLMAVGFDPDTGSAIGTPRVLVKGSYTICSPMRCYDPAPDGQHFVIMKDPPPGTGDPVNTQIAVILNWFDELKRLAPANTRP